MTLAKVFLRQVAVILLACVLPFQSWGNECMVFGKPAGKMPGLENLIEEFKSAMDAAGLCVRFVPRSAERDVAELKNGLLDGTLMRVRSFRQLVGPHAVMVGEPLAETVGELITYDPKLVSIEAIGERPIAVLQGIKWPMDILPARVHVVRANSYESLTMMFRAGRVDAVLINAETANSLGLHDDSTIVTPVVDLAVYPWVHSDHKGLAEIIAKAMRASRVK